MHLSSLFRNDLIIMDAGVDSKETAIRLLTDRVAETHQRLDARLLYEKVMEREAMVSTTFPFGLAVPHARIEQFEDLVIAVLVSEKPVDEIRVMFLILTDLTRSNLYLNVLAAIAKIGRDEHTIGQLAEADSPRDFIRILESFDLTVEKTVHVSDLMNAPPQYLYPDSTVKEALDFMTVTGFGYIPVCDDNQQFLGEVTVREILSSGLPQYAQMLTNLKFLSTLEPFEDLLKNESVILLRSIMRDPPIVLSPKAVVFEAAFQFVKHNRPYFPVVDNGKCVGVLSNMDMINKFLRV